MNLTDAYTYLGRARRDLWTVLEAAPEAVLTNAVLPGDRFHCIKDLVFHIAAVEDGWLHEDILCVAPVLNAWERLAATSGGPEYASIPLATLLDYWRAVETQMLGYLATLTEAELARVVVVHDAPDERYTVHGLLWHVLLHEVRHTAQICVLLRQQDVHPPALDLPFYLPRA